MRYPTLKTKEPASMALRTTRRTLVERIQGGDSDGDGAR
jgi:hypothetical protein